ncbi:MAG: 2-oxoacid:acceptor oxidoreductase family protein, partial [Chloroflexota bacterium]|nr:2-oxoacid:acceptor oxidoreductase family protein [Chloroflexota bacterium]
PHRLEQIAAIQARSYDLHPLRTPNYCSGCPHNTSTRLLQGQIAWGSPGCHSFATLMEQPHRHIEAMTQYGGEGLPWVGLSRFTDRPHMIQNVGDGSLFHSSYLNIRFCVAAGVNITYKILYNGSIANTGAQPPVGVKNVPDLTRLLELEGVSRIAVVTKSLDSYHGVQLAANAHLFSRDQYDAALDQLTREQGVTVLIYDEMCANERRRRRKRGKLAPAQKFVLINEAVCEGCGDCGTVSNCMSLQRVETEFGQKTYIHQSSCNQDYLCLKGDCPSFVTVEAGGEAQLAKPSTPRIEAGSLPEPAAKVTSAEPYHVYIPGVGGTGVITLNALLSYAALLDGKHVLSYDQTGAAQKWGPVLSSLIVADEPQALAANKVGLGKADLYLATDIVGAVTPINLDRCDPARTAAVVNTTVFPNGEMVRNIDFTISSRPMQTSLRRFTKPEQTVFVEARALAEKLFGDYMMTNIVTLGAAYQSGLIPLTAESIEAAIRINGVQVEANTQGFRYGRLFVHDPASLQQLLEPPRPDAAQERERARSGLKGRQREAYERLSARASDLDEESRRLLAI